MRFQVDSVRDVRLLFGMKRECGMGVQVASSGEEPQAVQEMLDAYPDIERVVVERVAPDTAPRSDRHYVRVPGGSLLIDTGAMYDALKRGV